MENLIKQLTEQLQPLKEAFINRTEEHANRSFDNMEKFFTLSSDKQYDFFGIKHEPVKVHNGCILRKEQYDRMTDEYKAACKDTSVPLRGEYGTKNYSKFRKATNTWETITRHVGRVKYVEKERGYAIIHFEGSVVKLARRIIDKGLDIETITLKTESEMDKGNISTTIKDAKGKIVRAWTILAWGEVNAPHFRYLIK